MSSAQKATRNKHLKKSDLGKLDITKDELERIGEAMKKEEFRKLLVEYIEEIQDPENRKRYEAEIIQLEAERGVDAKFVNPQPGFVIKTAVDGDSKCFINVAKSNEVAAPTHEAHTDQSTGKRGLNWALPLAQTPVREDVDNNNKRCYVYDVVFHPDTLRLAECNQVFRKCLIDTALDAVERAYEVKLDRTNLKFPKMNYKGIARPTLIRKLATESTVSLDDNEPDPLAHIYPKKPTADSAQPKKMPMKTGVSKQPEFTTPKYVIKQRRNFDMSECTYELDAKLNATVPKELVVEIELPLLKSTGECQLDVTSRTIYLLSERKGAKYRLNLDLPYEVNDKAGNARFDTDTRQLLITLPVKQPTLEESREMHNRLLHMQREDSGVESDVREEILSNPRTSPVEEITSDDSAHIKDQSPERPMAVQSFLNPNTVYKFPAKFDCNVLDNMMSLVLHVYNVQQQSIAVQQTERSVHLRFSCVGTGYCPTDYAFYLELPPATELKISNAQAEAWENNVVVNVTLLPSNETVTQIECKSYLAGLNPEQLKEYPVQGKFQLNAKTLRAKSPCYVDVSIAHGKADTAEAVEVCITPRPHTPPRSYKEERKNNKARSYSESTCDDFNKQLQALTVAEPQTERTAACQIPSTEQRKQRSYSECRSDSLGSNNTLPNSFKGILKRRSRYDKRPSISDSSSSMDDSCYGCSADGTVNGGYYSLPKNFNNCIPEEESTEAPLSESCKKTVRFNDNIKKLVFRMDSSILGQRKKNQKCRIRKQRALQRRLSEGDSADYEDNNHHNNNNNHNNTNHIIKAVQYLKDNISHGNNHHNNTNHKNHNNNNNHKNNEKSNKKSRPRKDSESSDVDNNKNSMMFEMDM